MSEFVPDEMLELTALSLFGRAPDERVPESPPEGARELRGFVDATRHLEDELRPRPADRLVLGERAPRLFAVCELVGEHDSILDRLRCPLPDARGGRVCGVADEREQAVSRMRQLGFEL